MELRIKVFMTGYFLYGAIINFAVAMWYTQPNSWVTLQEISTDTFQFTGSYNNSLPQFREFKLALIENENIIIGAANHIFIISRHTFKMKDRIDWPPSNNEGLICKARMKSELECQNHIRVLVRKNEDQLFVCGTNAFKPKCRTYKRMNNSMKYSQTNFEEKNGIGLCSFDPNYNNTAILLGNWLVSATVADFAARDALIYGKSIDSSYYRPQIRTEQFASDILNEPSFVQSFEYGDKVYFFFRETAVEAIHNRKTVYSRVGRICKNDQGGSSLLQESWTSFFKARLTCSVPGNFPFYFDEIQSTSMIGKSNFMELSSRNTDTIYAVFNTPENSIQGSAVCAFKFRDIVSTFEGPFKEKKTPHSNWLPLPEAETPTPHPAKYCANESITDLATLNFIKSHPIMDMVVEPLGGRPNFIQTSSKYRLTVITVDWQVETKFKKYDVLFIGTTNGHVLKTISTGTMHSNFSIPVLIEDIKVFDNNAPIINIQVVHSKDNTRLLVITKQEIKSIALQRCNTKKTCSECVALQDPYCSWNIDVCEFSQNGIQSIETGWHTHCTGASTSSLVFADNSPKFSVEMIIAIVFTFLALILGIVVGFFLGYLVSYKHFIYL